MHTPGVLGVDTSDEEEGAGDAELIARQWLVRYGVVSRDWWKRERPTVSWREIYQELKRLEFRGEVRRGYFVAGLGAAQFAMPAALDLLRSMRESPDAPRTVVMAATDPANPYGTILKWPGEGAARTVGSRVIIVDGLAAGYLRRGERELLLFAPDAPYPASKLKARCGRGGVL